MRFPGRGAGCGGDRAELEEEIGELRVAAERLAEEARELVGEVPF
jgi:hypothetical protein